MNANDDVPDLLPAERIIQIQPWRDLLLGLTDKGAIHILIWVDDRAELGGGRFVITGGPAAFPGFPRPGR